MDVDVCTLIYSTIMTLQACFQSAHCAEPKDGKQFCTPEIQVPCQSAAPTYECKRPDGSTYLWSDVK